MTDEGLWAVSEARCASLIELKLRSCAELTDAGVLAVSGLSRLTSLDLTGCSKVTDTGLQAVAALTALAELSLGQCFRVTDGGLRAVSASPTLTSLDLTNCSKMGDVAGMRVLGTLPALTVRDPPHPAVGRKGRKRERDNRGACATFWMAHTARACMHPRSSRERKGWVGVTYSDAKVAIVWHGATENAP